MSDSIATLVTVALVALTLVMLAFAIRKLRQETRISTRALLIGAVVPLATTVAYAFFSGAWGALLVLPLAIGIAVGIGLAWLTRVETSPSGPVVRQSGLTMIVWSAVYAVTALASLFAQPSIGFLTIAALALTGGMAAGSQIGLFLRTRSRSSPVYAPVAPVAPVVAAPTPVAQVAPPPPVAAAPPTQPELAEQAAPQPAAHATAGPVHYTHFGVRFVLGYTASSSGIWDRGAPDSPVASYPRTTEGRAAAWSQFSTWEPGATPVMPYAGLATSPIADVEVEFTHLGARFAIGRSASGYAIWDRWAPGPPVASFGLDDASALQAWQTFSQWEPQAVAL